MTRREFKEKYHKYLKSDEWKSKKDTLISQRGLKCERCDKNLVNFTFDIHHLTYKNIFNEQLEDLQILCRPCHERVHNLDRAYKYISSEKQEDHFFINQYKKPFTKTKVPKRKRKKPKKTDPLKKIKDFKKIKGSREKTLLVRRFNDKGVFEIKGVDINELPLSYIKGFKRLLDV